MTGLAALARPRVGLLVAAGTLFGALLRRGHDPSAVAGAVLGSLLLCAGCSALNQYQERDRDALMERTRNRPLPSGSMPPGHALAWAAAWMGAGLGLFAWAGGPILLGLGLAVATAYNGAYTWLKPRTPLALLAGGLAGAAPPLAGWLAAGGPLSHPLILAACGLFYLWQVPHFWLLAEKHRQDYQRAGFPLPSKSLRPGAYRPLMALWMLSYGLAAGWLAALRLPGPAAWAVLAAALAVAAASAAWSMQGRTARALAAINGSLAMAMIGLVGLAG